MERTAASGAGWSWQAGNDSRIEAVGQWLLEGSRSGRMSIVHVGGRWGGLAAGRGSGWSGGTRIRPGTDVGWTAVEALERSVVAGFGEELEADGRLAFPLGSGIRHK